MRECHAGSSRDAMTPLAPLLVSSGRCSGWGSHGWSEAGEEGEGVRAERGRRTQEHKRDRVCEKKCRSPACASHGGQNRPWTLRYHTQVSQRETISSLRIRWAEGGGRPQNTKEDFTCEEPPRRPSRATLFGKTGRRCSQPPAPWQRARGGPQGGQTCSRTTSIFWK